MELSLVKIGAPADDSDTHRNGQPNHEGKTINGLALKTGGAYEICSTQASPFREAKTINGLALKRRRKFETKR